MTSAALDLTWVDDPAALAPLNGEWLDLAEAVHADVFARPGWLALWWHHFGAGRRFAALVARQGGVLVGVMPFTLETVWAGPVPVRLARPAGIDNNAILFRWAVQPPHLPALLRAAYDHLTGPLGAAAISFTPVSEEADHAPVLRDGFAAQGRLIEAPAGVHIVFDLPDSFDTYLASLTKKRRSEFRRMVKGLTEAFQMVSASSHPTPADFDRFIAFHSQQWQAVGKGGHFSDWPGTGPFYRALTEPSVPETYVQLDSLTGAGVGEIATEFSLVAGGTAHWRLPARSLDPEIDRLGAGKVVFLLMFERMLNDGITRIEAGRGDYPYKIDYGGRYVDVRRMILRRDGTWPAVQLKLLLAWADLLHLLYYRIWFLKIVPRLRRALGWKHRPLARSWIRTRL